MLQFAEWDQAGPSAAPVVVGGGDGLEIGGNHLGRGNQRSGVLAVLGSQAIAHFGGWPYERVLAIHLLAAELLLVWFPFGKLMHAFTIFVARGSTGMLFERKGASL